MGEPIKIVVTAETAQAAAALQQFVQATGSGLAEVAKNAGHAGEALGQNRFALMELGHVARSTAESLAFGMNPLRVLALEAPRIVQANAMLSTEMRATLLRFLPALGLVGVAVGAGVVAWKYYGEALVDPTKRARELADALDKIPDILEKINVATRAGSINEAAAEKYRKLASGETPLYNVNTIPDAYGGHASTVRNGALGLFGEEFPQLTTDPNIRNSRTGAIVGRRDLANKADVQKYVEQLLRTNQVTDANDKTKPGDAADVELNQEELKIHRDAEIGTQRQIDRIKDRYAVELRLMAEKRQVEIADGTWTDAKQKKYDETVKESAQAEKNSIDELLAREEHVKNEKVDFAKDAADQIRALEDSITDKQEQAGAQRGQFAAEEYKQRVFLAEQLFYSGEIEEDEYTHLITEAAKKRAVAEKEYTQELQRQAQLKQEIARADVEAQLAGIKGNPFLTQSQKDSQSLPLLEQLQQENAARIAALQTLHDTTKDTAAQLQAEQQITDLKRQQAELGNQIIEAQKSGSFTYSFGAMFAEMSNQAAINFTTLANTFKEVFDNASRSISNGLTGLIMGTQKWRQALLQVETSILTNVVQAIVSMGVRWLLTQALMAVGGRAILASAVAASAPLAAAQSAIWAVPATLATIATFGGAAAAAPGFIGAADAITLGMAAGSFADGGYTGPGGKYDIAGVVHAGEFVLPADAVNRIGLGNLEAMRAGGSTQSSGGATALPPGGKGVSVYAFTDPRQMADHLQKNDAHEKWVVDVMSRNIHKFR